MIAERTLPTTSIGIVGCVTAVVLTVLLAAVGVGTQAWLGVASGVGLSLSLWLAQWEQWQTVGRFLSSLLVVPVTVGIAVSLIGTVAALSAGTFPIESVASVQTELIDIGTRTVIVGGCILAAIGVTAAPFGVIDTETTGAYTNLLLRVQLIPVGIASVLFASNAISLFQSRGLVGNFISSFTAVFFAPAPGRTHIAVFCLMAAVGTALAARAIGSLPFVELFPEFREEFETATAQLVRAGWLGVLLVFPAGLVEFGLGQQWLASLIPRLVYDVLVVVTAAPLFRQLIWWLCFWSCIVIALVRLLRRLAQESSEAIGTTLGPYVAGAVVSGVAVAASDQLLSALLERVPASETVSTTIEPLVSQFGSGSIILVLLSAVLGISGLLAGALWFALRVRYVPERTSGVTLAASGLFLASGAALTLDVPTLLGMGGLVGAIIVWDAGAFGETLRTEMGGDTETRRTELVHTGGTLSVGAVGSLLTVGLVGTAQGTVSIDPGTAIAVLVFCLVAVVALIIALR